MKPWEISASCETCGKKMFERDRSYSMKLFDQVYCAKCIPAVDKRGNKTITLKR